MWRMLAVLTLLLTGALAGIGSWRLFHPSVTPFLVPGATNIQVVSTGVLEWQITYDAPGPPYAWYETLARSIEAQQWNDRTLWRPDGSTMFDPVTALRFEREYAGVLWDEVVLAPDRRDPQRATITLRRRIRIPWWQEWSPAGYQGAAIAGRRNALILNWHPSAVEVGSCTQGYVKVLFKWGLGGRRPPKTLSFRALVAALPPPAPEKMVRGGLRPPHLPKMT